MILIKSGGTELRLPGIRVKWFVGNETIGVGKIRLLEKVGELGSMSGAARSMGMGYRRTWFLINSLQQGFEAPLVETVRGGKTHGGTVITELGRELVRRFNTHEAVIKSDFASCSEWLQTAQASDNNNGSKVSENANTIGRKR